MEHGEEVYPPVCEGLHVHVRLGSTTANTDVLATRTWWWTRWIGRRRFRGRLLRNTTRIPSSIGMRINLLQIRFQFAAPQVIVHGRLFVVLLLVVFCDRKPNATPVLVFLGIRSILFCFYPIHHHLPLTLDRNLTATR